MDIINWLTKKPKKQERVRIVTPSIVRHGKVSKEYYNRETYPREKLKPYIKGRKVKYWKKVKEGDLYDEFVPIFYKSR